ncbi:MAG: cytochrome C oxidase subunit IV family protein, partial [Chloroflexi bacterium SZAS-1]|nr:cytochrome C oxidase subunit IV family protein [Chloroflexi bacterium SZAS-1]
MADNHNQEHSPRFYLIVGAALAVITVAEVLVTFLPMPAFLLLAILLVMMVVKGAAVVMFFMHLRGDANVFKFLFIAPLIMGTTM